MRRAAAAAVLGVMVSGLLSLTAIVRAGAPAVSPTLSPPAGRGAVKGGDTLTVGGIAGPQDALVRAELRFLDPAGEPVRGPSDSTWSVRIDGGAISGTAMVPSLCPDQATGEDCLQRANDGTVVLALTVDRGGQPVTGISNGVPIDVMDPYILRTALVAPDRIEVRFSEPVDLPDGVSESELDALGWTIGGHCQKGRPVLSVQGQGAFRQLTLAVAEDEDATPMVTFCPLPNRPAYQDRAGRNLAGAGRITLALDRIAPKIPVVTEIAGRVGNNVAGNDPSPVVHLSGLRPGHFGRVYLEGGDEPGFQRSQDTFLGEAQAGASGTADVQVLQDLGPDGTYTLYGVARDRAKCTSDAGSAECPNYSGGDMATYRLDTVVPGPIFAATDGPTVTVRFSEPVFGTDDPSQWSVTPGTPPTSVSGTGPERFLDGGNTPAGATVTWTRPASGGYTDDAGNEVASFATEALDFIPPVITVTDPVTTVWTSATSYRITGSVSKDGSVVEAFRDGSLVERHALGPSERDFAIDLLLLADRTNSFVLRATDPLGNVSRQDAFLPGIVQDSTAPSVSVLAPTEDARLAGGAPVTIRWEAADANFGPGPISIFFSHDGGPWKQVAANEANDGEFAWEVPHAAAGQGQIRIVAEDRVGFTAEDLSALFSIDSEAPAFGAVTAGLHHVAVQFTEPLTGSVAADEWTIDGLPAASASEEELTADSDLSGISRLLLETVPAQEIGRNDLPMIAYDPGTVPGRQELQDEAGNEIPEGARSVQAEDGIAPLVPSIDAIAGQAPGGESEDGTPDVEIGNIDEGDTALVFVESDGTAGFSDGDRIVGSAVAGAEGATVTTDTLGADADYTLYATARDPGGNLSDGADDALYKLRSGILPAVPVIEQIAGQPADVDVTANDPSPDVKVGSIAEGFVAEVYADTDATSGFSQGDRKLGEAAAGEDGAALVQTSDLGPDGAYTLLAVARNAVGRRSAGADDAKYILDATSPAFTAKVLDSRHVAVEFTEPVSGMIAEIEWKIDGTPANTTREPGLTTDIGKFSLETLQIQEIAVGASPEISYGPIGAEAASPAPAELRDDAGNFIRSKVTRAIALTGGGPGGTGGTGEQPPAQPSEQPGGVPGEPTADLVCTIVGTAGNDILLGTEGPDVMCPQGGEDRIVALGGDDVVLGGEGAKLIEGGSGNDLLIGGNAADRIYGGMGRDRLYGKGASDRLFGGAGRDRLVGGAARDRLNGGPAIDTCKGGAGRDAFLRCEGGTAR